MTVNLVEDHSRWTMLSSRFDTDGPVHQMFNEMFEEWIESLPLDSEVRLLYSMLPKPPVTGAKGTK